MFNIKHKIYLIFSLATAVVFTILQTDLLYFFYDADVFLYSAETNLPNIYGAILLLCIVLIATSLIFFRKESFPDQITEPKSVTVFISAVCGIVFLIAFGYNMFYYISNINTIEFSLHVVVKLVASICAAPSAAYFLVIALKKNPYKNPTAMFGLCIVIWAALNLIGEYFNMNTPLNDPVRILHQISYIGIMLFYLYDAGYSADIRKPVLYQMYGYLAIIFIAISSIPAIILNLFNLKPLSSIDIMSYYVEFCLVVFIICRMFTIKKPPNNVIGEDS